MTVLWRWLARLGRGLRVLVNSLSRLFYVALITLAAVVLWLMFTTSGAQWLAERAMAEEERLQLEITGGSLWNGLDVRAVQWRDEGVAVTVEEAELRWNHLCLLRARVCVNAALVRGVDARVDTDAMPVAEDDGEPAADGGDPFPLPVDIAFPQVRAQQVDVTVDGHRARWSDLRLGGALEGRTLTLSRFNWESILVELPEGDDAEAVVTEDPDAGPGFLETGWDGLELPEVELPLNIVVDDLRLHDLRVVQGPDNELLALDRFSVAGELRDRRARLRQLEVVHAQGRLRADGSLTMRDDWPVDLELQVEARDLPEVGDLTLDASLWNSIGDLEFRLQAGGLANLALEGTVAPGREHMPMNVQAQWDTLGWPLDTRDLVAARDGRLSLQGDLTDYRLDLGATVDGADIPEGRWQVDAAGDLQGAQLERLRGELLDGWLEVTGTAAWHPDVEWDASVELQGLAASRIVEQAPESVSGALRTRGRLAEDDLAVDVEIDRIEAAVEGHELVLSGAVHRPAGGDWNLQDIQLRTGESLVSLAGRVGTETLDVEGSLDVADLGAFLPDAAGRVHGDFAASGALTAPDITAAIEAGQIRYGDLVSVDSVDLDAAVAGLGEQASRLRLAVRGVELEAETVDSVDVLLEGDRSDHRLSLDVDARRAAASVTVAGALSEALDWDGALERAELSAADQRWQLDASTPVRFDMAAQQARIDPHCWRYDGASLCAGEPILAGASGEASVALEGFDLALLAPWLPQAVELDGRIGAEVDARWGETPLPVVALDARIDDGQIRVIDPESDMDDDQVDLVLDYERLGLRLDLDEDRLRTAISLRSDDLGTVDLSANAAVVGGDQPFGPLDGEVDIRAIELGVIEPFFPELRTLRGTISAQGQLAGEVMDPRYHGTVSLTHGRVEPVAIGMELRDIGLELGVDGDNATLTGGFSSGDGTATITGEADWADELSAAVNLSGSALQVVYDPLADLRVNPDIDVTFADNTLRLGGELRVPRGEITLVQLPESAVQVSGDVVIIDDQPEAPEPADDQDLEEAEEALAGAPDGLNLETDLQIVLGNRVNLSGFGITGRLTGDLRLQQSGSDEPQGFGEIRIMDGEYRAYGQRLRIREGQLLFSGPLDRPQLYVEAVRRIERDDVTAGLRLEGNPEEPRVSLFSEPAMGEEDVLSYIILGRPAGQGGGDDNMLGRAALALGMAGGSGYATALAEEIGIQDFTIDTEGDGDDTQVVVGGYINPNLYLGYGVGVFTPVNTLTLRYRLATNLYLEAVTSLESAIDLLYRFEFGSRG